MTLVKEKMKATYQYSAIRTCLRWLHQNNYRVVALMIIGCQNYELDEFNQNKISKIKVLAIVYHDGNDSFDLNEQIKINIINLKTFYQQLIKSNPDYLEAIYSKYYLIVDSFFKDIIKMKDLLLKSNRDLLMINLLKIIDDNYQKISSQYDQDVFNELIRYYLVFKYIIVANLTFNDCFNQIKYEELIIKYYNQNKMTEEISKLINDIYYDCHNYKKITDQVAVKTIEQLQTIFDKMITT